MEWNNPDGQYHRAWDIWQWSVKWYERWFSQSSLILYVCVCACCLPSDTQWEAASSESDWFAGETVCLCRWESCPCHHFIFCLLSLPSNSCHSLFSKRLIKLSFLSPPCFTLCVSLVFTEIHASFCFFTFSPAFNWKRFRFYKGRFKSFKDLLNETPNWLTNLKPKYRNKDVRSTLCHTELKALKHRKAEEVRGNM